MVRLRVGDHSGGFNPLPRYQVTLEIERCRKCGDVTDFIPYDKTSERHKCRKCGFEYLVVDDGLSPL